MIRTMRYNRLCTLSARRVLLPVLLACSTHLARAQGTAYTDASELRASDLTAPVRVRVRAGDRLRTVTLVGRTDEGILFTEEEDGSGTRFLLKPSTLQEIEFILPYDPAEVIDAVQRRAWSRAIRVLRPAINPTRPYLDLPDNNAVAAALDLGSYMMRAAAQQERLGRRAEDAGRAERMYTSAYHLFTDVARADWSYIATLAKLKRIQCLLALQKPKTARRLFEGLDEPLVGDAAYGLYWLLKAQIALRTADVRTALDAAVNSLCFENKDIETFPDALLVSATCYEKLDEWHRARDVYYELARIFPTTDWQAIALRRLRFIRAEGLTEEEEEMPLQNVYFGVNEDVNARVDELLEDAEHRSTADAAPAGATENEIDLETAE